MMLRYVCKVGGLLAASLLVWSTASSAFTPNTKRSRRSKSICYNNRLDKGFNLLEIASGIVPQGAIVQTAREGWKFAWKRMMAELAPQDKTGSYQRPSYPFQGRIGTPQFPDEPGRYHLYVGNPCPYVSAILAIYITLFYHSIFSQLVSFSYSQLVSSDKTCRQHVGI